MPISGATSSAHRAPSRCRRSPTTTRADDQRPAAMPGQTDDTSAATMRPAPVYATATNTTPLLQKGSVDAQALHHLAIGAAGVIKSLSRVRANTNHMHAARAGHTAEMKSR